MASPTDPQITPKCSECFGVRAADRSSAGASAPLLIGHPPWPIHGRHHTTDSATSSACRSADPTTSMDYHHRSVGSGTVVDMPSADDADPHAGVRRFPFRYDAWCGWILGLFLSGRSVSHIDVGPDDIDVRLGIAFSGRVPRSSIVSLSRWHGPVYGWGAHGWRGRWLVNGSSKGIVVLHIEPPARGRVIGFPVKLKELALSPEDPDGLSDALGIPIDG